MLGFGPGVAVTFAEELVAVELTPETITGSRESKAIPDFLAAVALAGGEVGAFLIKLGSSFPREEASPEKWS